MKPDSGNKQHVRDKCIHACLLVANELKLRASRLEELANAADENAADDGAFVALLDHAWICAQLFENSKVLGQVTAETRMCLGYSGTVTPGATERWRSESTTPIGADMVMSRAMTELCRSLQRGGLAAVLLSMLE